MRANLIRKGQKHGGVYTRDMERKESRLTAYKDVHLGKKKEIRPKVGKVKKLQPWRGRP